MLDDTNRQLVQRLYDEVFNRGNLALLDEIMTPDFLDHSPREGQAPGREGFKRSVALGRQEQPGIYFTIEDMLAEGDRVAVRLLARYPFQGKQVEMTGMGFFRCRDGRLAEAWWNMDTLSLLQQLGLITLEQ